MDSLLAHFGTGADRRLGGGGEADVYAVDADRVLRVYKRPSTGLAGRLRDFYAWLGDEPLPWAVPSILDLGEHDGLTWTIDRRLPGTGMFTLLPTLSDDDKAVAIANYVRASVLLATVRPPARGLDGVYGDVLAEDPIRTGTWAEFLMARVEPAAARAAPDLAGEGVDAHSHVARLRDLLGSITPPDAPSLVHGDWYPGNVMMADDLTVTAVVDFSSITFAGDPMMDRAGAVIFADAAAWPKPDQVAVALATARTMGADDLDRHLDLYRLWYGLYFSQYKADDARLFARCVGWLKGEE